MADRKPRTVVFKTPKPYEPVHILRAIVDGGIAEQEDIEVMQHLSSCEVLLQTKTKELAEEIIEEGFELEDTHIECNPPVGVYKNVSIIGLRAYVEDEEVMKILRQFGTEKGPLIRLKFKRDHPLAGMENGNRMVSMHLRASVPYALKIDGLHCRVIHNQQEKTCTNCRETGHTVSRCPDVKCFACGANGHMSRFCTAPRITTRTTQHKDNEQREINKDENSDIQDTTNNPNDNPEKTKDNPEKTRDNKEQEQPTTVQINNENLETDETPQEDIEIDDYTDTENIIPPTPAQGVKRGLPTSSEDDAPTLPRRSKLNFKPNTNAARKTKTTKTSDKPQLESN